MIFLKRLLYKVCVSCRPNTSRTVRLAFPMAFAAIVVLGAAAITNNNASYIKLTTSDTSVKTGEFFTINVLVKAHKPVNAVDIKVDFPKDQIEVLGIDKGESVLTIWTEEPTVFNNTVILRGGTFRKGFIGEHLIAQINAKAKQNGNAKFTVGDATILAGDGKGTKISLAKDGTESLTMYVALKDGLNDQGIIEGTVSVGIYTDINGDGKVDMNDILAFMSAWGNNLQKYDFNNDGKMNFVDFAIILADSFFK